MKALQPPNTKSVQAFLMVCLLMLLANDVMGDLPSYAKNDKW
jgi:hypothetical protein